MRIERSTLEALDSVIVAAVGTTTVALAEANPGGELTFPQWRVLVVVGETRSGVRVSDIASRIGSSSPSTSRLIRRMERAGLVSAERDERDRRATIVRLTSPGAKLRSRVIAQRRRLVARLFRDREGVLPGGLESGLLTIADILSSLRGPTPA
jgi:DNA-binding MarR family transcriptional regulator